MEDKLTELTNEFKVACENYHTTYMMYLSEECGITDADLEDAERQRDRAEQALQQYVGA
jgi:hypothetical protein